VKVQVKSTPKTKPKPAKKLSLHAVKNLNALAEKVPGTSLADALLKLVKNAK
jgi:hypothetical protein